MKSKNQYLGYPSFTFHNLPIEDYINATKNKSSIYEIEREIKRILKFRTGHDFTDCILFNYKFKKHSVDFTFMFKSWMMGTQNEIANYWKKEPEDEIIIEKLK